jgi:hypothetical protein
MLLYGLEHLHKEKICISFNVLRCEFRCLYLQLLPSYKKKACNYLTHAQGRVISGHTMALEHAAELARAVLVGACSRMLTGAVVCA